VERRLDLPPVGRLTISDRTATDGEALAGVRVVAVAVTYHPDVAGFGALLDALRPQVDAIVVVDNGTPEPVLGRVAALLADDDAFIPLGTNQGIAAAQNAGIERAIGWGATHVLLSDDDSLPAADMVERLVAAFRSPVPEGRVAAVGPVTVDPRTMSAPLVFTDQRTGPRRIPALPSADGAQVEVAFLIASGCLIDVAALREVGFMNADLFIDHVDLEWGVRARGAGWSLRVVVGAQLAHHLGDGTRPVPWRSRAVHIQAPIRNYFMVRNTVWLIRGTLLPSAWRRGYFWWIARYIGYYVLAVRPRWQRTRLMAAGLRDGLRGRLGPR
jgi:rhamnosyltransferase